MRCIAAGLCGLLLAGCGVELVTSTAIVGELHKENAQAMNRQLGAADQSMAKTRLQKAINAYHAEKGYYPKVLQDLVPDYLNFIPVQPDGTLFNYDPNTGKLLEGPGALPPSSQIVTSGESYKMQKIREAINAYGYDTGYYPASLAELVPQYISHVPLTDSGQQFIYDPSDGYLAHPNAAHRGAQSPDPQGTPRTSGTNLGGAGPLGEVTTGISISNQLGNMNQSGAAGVRSTAGSQLGSRTQNYQNAQDRALRELDY